MRATRTHAKGIRAVSPGNAKLCRLALAAAGALCSAALAAPDAHATLGGDVASIAVNEQRMGASRHVHKLASGERHDLTLASGTVVREYVSATGVVYAVTWRGPRIPDLRELLGSHFAELSDRDPGGGHHRMTVTRADFMVRSIGHGHSFAGRAWVPSLVPSGAHPEIALDEGP